MANKKARLNDKDGGTVSSLQTIRVPFFYTEDFGNSPDGSYTTKLAQILRNGYFEEIKTQTTNTSKYRVVKRPGLDIVSSGVPAQATVTGLRGRGIYYWNSNIYTIWGTRIYSGSTLLYTGLNSSTDTVSFCETHPDATTQYLCINDGTSLYLIDTSNNVLVMNNVVVSTSSVAVSSVITTATAHGLATGNRVIIRNHAGSTPSINNTIYTVTVLTPTTFSIPVNVTVAGTGGTIGVFPGNVGSIEFLDGYMFVGTVAGRIYNCDFNDPTTWNTTSYITAQMQNDDLIGLGKQNNYIVVFKEKTIQFFYDKGDNIVGQTPLANVEQSMQQIGCWSRQSIVSNTNTMFWVGNSRTGEASVFKLDGASKIDSIGTAYTDKLLIENSNFLTTVKGYLVTINGQIFYGIDNPGYGFNLVWNDSSQTWSEWASSFGSAFPSVWAQIPISGGIKKLYGIDTTSLVSGYTSELSALVGTDIGSDITVTGYLSGIDLDTSKRKFWERVELVTENINNKSTFTATGTVTIGYSDTQSAFPTSSRQWTVNSSTIENRFWYRASGNSRKRWWYFTHSGNSILTKYICFEFDVRISEF